MDIFRKFLPPQAQKVLPQIEKLLEDDAVVSDLIIVFEEMEKGLDVTSRLPAADKKLKNAFNDAATIASVGKNYLKDGKVSMMTMAKLASGKNRMKDNMAFLANSFKEKQPVTLAFANAMKGNTTFSEAIKRLVVRTHGSMFCLEAGENGQGYAVELLTGQSMRVPLEKEDYAELQKAIYGQPNPPTPPASPAGPA